MYKENPKTKGSGILCAIPQTGVCPMGCMDCFFQSGRSYLEPLEENLPNMPDPEMARGFVIRVNDGNDSANQSEHVIESTAGYEDRFFNTSAPLDDLSAFPAPVVVTVNPGDLTDFAFRIPPVHVPTNLMFVRFRVNTWNLALAEDAVTLYTRLRVPVVMTFMAYHEEAAIPESHRPNYIYRQRTKNSYWAITTDAWRSVMSRWEDNPFVYSCGKIEGERGITSCARCGNCLREYFNTKVRMQEGNSKCC